MDRIRIERFGPDLLALDPDAGIVHRIAPADARELAAGRWEPYVGTMGDDVLDAVLAALDRPRWDRRRILAASGALTAAGISTLLLPSAATAASLFGVAFGTGFENGPVTFVPTDGNAVVSYGSSYLTWSIPTGVTQVQIVAWSTSGSEAGSDPANDISPHSGAPGRGVYAAGTFDVTPESGLVIAFSSAADWSVRYGGGAGGQAVGVGDLSLGTSGVWLVVAGGGGGAGNAGYNANTGYLSGSYQGGDGGDAGTGGTAGDGTAGSGDDAGFTSQGGGGATVLAAGAGSAGSQSNLDGQNGGGPLGPTNSSASTRLGEGGTTFNNASSGGRGGGGLYGGGAAGSNGNGSALGGGGGGASYLDTAKRSTGSQSRIETFNRTAGSFAKVDLYY